VRHRWWITAVAYTAVDLRSGERGVAELVEDVVGAPDEFAGFGYRGAFAVDAVFLSRPGSSGERTH
jgi:hypothetical protein